MRVKKRVQRSERGAVLILVSVFAIVAVIFLAFVVDIGNQRQDRRQFTTATDASALDVAQDWANLKLASSTYPAGDCSTDAKDYLDRNRADHDSYDCVATKVDGRLGSVTVFSKGSVDYEFGKAVGIDKGSTNSATTVRIRSTTGGGLRPFAVCASESLGLEAWIAAWENGVPLPTDLIIGGPKFLPSNCGENNGNWGMVQFQSQDNGVGNIDGGGLAGVLAKGSLDETITVDESATGNPDAECNKSYVQQESENGISCVFQVTGNPWSNNGVRQAFDLLKMSGTVFNLPVYGERVPIGNGSSTGFPIIGFIEVELLSYCGDPAPTAKAQAQLLLGACSGGKDNFVHVKLNKLTSGTCCDVNKDNRLLEICDVGDIGGNVDAVELLQNCQTPDGTSGPPPVVPDPACTLTGVSPVAQDVTVNLNNDSVGPTIVSFDVLDIADCGSFTVAATGPKSVPAVVTGPVGNTYTATFGSGTNFASGGTTFAVEIAEDSFVLDDSATLTTVALAPCSASVPVLSPAPQRAPQGQGLSNDLVSDLTVSTSLTNPANCPTLSLKVFHPDFTSTLTATPTEPLGTVVSAVFGKKNPKPSWKWSAGTYVVQVQRNGVLLPGATTSFTLPSG